MVLYSCCLFYLTDIDAINDGQSMCNRREVLRLDNAVVPSPYQSTYSYSSQNSLNYVKVINLFISTLLYLYLFFIYMHIWRQMQYLFDHLKDTCINYHLIACKYMHVYLPLTVIETPDVKAKSTRISDGCPRTILLRLGF